MFPVKVLMYCGSCDEIIEMDLLDVQVTIDVPNGYYIFECECPECEHDLESSLKIGA